MLPLSFDDDAHRVLDRYSVSGSTSIPLGNRGGFSGARLWRVEGSHQSFCLRAWPPGSITAENLRHIHHLMHLALQAGLSFVPLVVSTKDGSTWIEHAGRLWDLTAWLPGNADFHNQPTLARLEAACTALALIHTAWSGRMAASGPCPAIQRRLATIREWTAMIHSGWRPSFAASEGDPIHPWAERAWCLFQVHFNRLPQMLAPWSERVWPLQPCLCDVWHDHLLFEGETLTGLVDYGGVKLDHVSVDLARMLGSLVGSDVPPRAVGLRAYTRLRPLSAAEEGLVPILDDTGTLLGMANWLKWLYREGRSFEDRHAVAKRLATLVERVERWSR